MNELDYYDQYCFDHFGKNAYWAVNKKLTKILKSGDAAIILAELIDRFEYFKIMDNDSKLLDGRFFYETIEALEEKTSFSREIQNTCIRKLKDLSLIEVEVRTKETRRYFKINSEKLHSLTMPFNHECVKNTIVEESNSSEKTDKIHECVNPTFVKADFTQKKRTNKEELISESHSVISGNSVPTKKRIIILSKREIIKRDKTNLVPVFRKEKKQPPLVVSSAVQEVIDYWKNFGFKVPGESTQGFRDAVKDINNVLNGTMFVNYTEPTFKSYTNQKYSVKDIKSAIDFHKSRRKNINYLPTNKDYLESITLSNFFFNRYSTIEETKSEFLICIAHPLVKTTNNSKLLLKDDLPNVTKLLTDWYKKTFSYKINGSYSMRDRNVIIRSGLKLKAFSETNKDKLAINEEHCRMYRITNDPVLYLAKALIHFWDDEISRNGGLLEKFEINFLASENLLTTKFPKFLKEEKAMR